LSKGHLTHLVGPTTLRCELKCHARNHLNVLHYPGGRSLLVRRKWQLAFRRKTAGVIQLDFGSFLVAQCASASTSIRAHVSLTSFISSTSGVVAWP
jgi:hypothetical protein